MKLIKIILIITISLCCCKSIFCQDKVYKEQLATKVLIDENSTEAIKKENVDLQSFVESIYINSSKFYNQALPTIKKGEYYVLIAYNDGSESKRIKTKDLKDISVDKIEEFAYKKSPAYTALYGSFAGMFGMVSLRFKK